MKGSIFRSNWIEERKIEQELGTPIQIVVLDY